MPNLETFKRNNNFPKNNPSRPLNVRREEIIYREDVKTAFGYSLVGIASALALAGAVYVIGKQLIK
jgi:hypothetical protein